MLAETHANARLIAAAPWLALLARCFAAGWTLSRAMLYDEEGVDGYRLENGRREFSWVGDILDADEQTYRGVEAAMKADGADNPKGSRP